MADPNDEAYAVFSTSELPDMLRIAHRLSRALYEKGHRKLADEVEDLLVRWIHDIDATAVVIAGASEGFIRAKIVETMAPNRPHSGEMETHIASKAGPLGTVAVALYGDLNKIINPFGPWSKPFWPAQEYGTGVNNIPSMEGRVIIGLFHPSETKPDADLAGGAGTDKAFHSWSVDRARGSGIGTIHQELPGRHFLRDGTALAGVKYLERMQEVTVRYLNEMRAIVVASKRAVAERPGRLSWSFKA